MDRNGGARAGIVTMVAMLMVFLLSAGSAARLPNPAGALRTGMGCLLFIHLSYMILESKLVPPPPPPPPPPPLDDPAPPHLFGWNENDVDGYRAPPQSPVSAYSSTESSVDDPPSAAPAETANLESSSSESEDVARSSRSASTRASSSSSTATSSSSRARQDLSDDSDLASSDFDWKHGYRRLRTPPSSGSKSSGSTEAAGREAKRPRSRGRRGGNKTNDDAYMKLRRMLCLAPPWRSASGRSRSPSLRSRRHVSGSDSDLSNADKVDSWTNGHHRRSPSTRSRSSSGRRSRSSASASRRSRGRRGAKKNTFTKLKKFFNGKR